MLNLTRPCAALVVVALAIPLSVSAQVPMDDLRVRQLESEVMRQQRELDAQSRRIDQLEQAARIASPTVLPGARPENSSPAWLVPASWDRIKRGMTAQEVIAILGRPTSARYAEDGKIRLLFYAMELGPSALLAGNISVGDAGVVEINRPVLK